MALQNFNIPNPQTPINKELNLTQSPRIPTREKALNVVVGNSLNNAKSAIIQGNATINESDELLRKSKLGTPIYTEVVIKKTDTTVVNADRFSSEQGYVRFDSCVVTVNQARNIIKTPIQGRNGTVKEYISDGDYQISIRGSIFGDAPDKLPSTILKDMHTLFIEPNELWIESNFLQYFDIKYCVIESYNIVQVEGSRSRIDIDITAISDDPIELQLGIKENA